MVEFTPNGHTIDAVTPLRSWGGTFKIVERGVTLLHGNARSHTVRIYQELLTSSGWEIVNRSPYSADLAALSDFHLFTELKEFLGGKRHSNDDEVKQTAEKWLQGLAGEVYNMGIQEPVLRLQECVELNDDYVEKYFILFVIYTVNFIKLYALFNCT